MGVGTKQTLNRLNEGRPSKPFKHRKVQRQVVMASFIAFLAISGILIVIMIRNCQDAGIRDSRSEMSSVGDETLSKPTEKDKNGTGSPDSDIDFQNEESSLSSNELDSRNFSVILSRSLSGEEQETEGETGEDGMYFPLKIEETKTNEVIAATTVFFKERIPYLQQAMNESGLFFSEKLLDPDNGTKAYILAKNENCAQNLNGYFYYLFDATGSTNIVSPFVLNISLLFDEVNRKTVIDSGTFAETKHAQALRQSLVASLGTHYHNEVFDFIMNEYKRTFQDRLAGKPLQTPAFKLRLSKLEVVFHNSFLTYVEFFINP